MLRRGFKLFPQLGLLLLLGAFQSCEESQTSEIPGNPLKDELRTLLIEKSPSKSLDHYLLPAETDLERIPQDPQNRLTPAKIDLGQKLFHDPGILVNPKKAVGMQSASCASCHFADAGFSAGVVQGLGEGGIGFDSHSSAREKMSQYETDSIDAQPLRSPTLLNTAFQPNMLWNGSMGATEHNVGTEGLWGPATPFTVNHLGFEGLESQALAAIKTHRMGVNWELFESTEYLELFQDAFPEFPEEERVSNTTMALAIAAFERTVLSSEAPFQKFLRGEDVLTEPELRGALLFFGKAKCNTCHDGAALSSNEFYVLGMNDFEKEDVVINSSDPNTNFDLANLGRGGFTKKVEDFYKFKVPQLYNLMDFKFYGHGASFDNLIDVLQYKIEGKPENSFVAKELLSEKFTPLDLTEEEAQDLKTFLELSLYDPSLDRFEPSSVPSGLCFPTNDIQARTDLGCQ